MKAARPPEEAPTIVQNIDTGSPNQNVCDPGSPFFARQKKIVLENSGVIDPERIEDYIAHDGYQGLMRAIGLTPADIIKEVTDSGLRGRGGAAFPTGVKWGFMPRTSPVQKYAVCNSDESEPGTCHDRDILRYNPHSVIEGMAIGGYAMTATVGYNYIRGEFLGEPIPRFEAALAEAYAAGLLGKNILGSGVDFDLRGSRQLMTPKSDPMNGQGRRGAFP